MKTITTTVYTFDELNDTAKAKARDWYRECASHDTWWEGIYEDAAHAGLRITSFDLDRRRHADGKFVCSAFHCATRIVVEHGAHCETFRTATAFLAEHLALDAADDEQQIEDCDAEFLKSILEDYSIILQREYEYQYSDECVDETIIANEYTFTESGKRAG